MSDNVDNDAPPLPDDREEKTTDRQGIAPPPVPEPHDDQQEETQPDDFSLSETNFLYFGIVAVLAAARFFMTNHAPTAHQIAVFAVSIVLFIVFPAGVALAAWYGSGKKKRSGPLAFNITLTVMVFGQIVDFLGKTPH